MDIKEAIAPAAPHPAKTPMPKNQADRVVEGTRKLSPFLGERMMPAKFSGREVFLRELLPQDLKVELDQLTREEATGAARFLAGVVGKAHGRQMNLDTRKRWHGELLRYRSKKLDAPSWLWSSVVELVGRHELAYLEHCRDYALRESKKTR